MSNYDALYLDCGFGAWVKIAFYFELKKNTLMNNDFFLFFLGDRRKQLVFTIYWMGKNL